MSLKSTHLERMRTAIIYDCEFKIAVEGGARYWLPFHASERRPSLQFVPDLGQNRMKNNAIRS